MPFKKILVPYDRSEHSMKAVKMACEMMRDDSTAQMRIVTVVPAPRIGLSETTEEAWTELAPPIALMDMKDYARVIAQVVEDERKEAVRAVGNLIAEFGDRAQVDAVPNLSAIEGITAYAEENDVDLIVMGRRGLGAFRGALGSVSYGILHSTDIPVLTVK